MNNITNPLALLIQAAEELFNLEPGDIKKLDRSQPLATYRKLAMKVARERGFTSSSISRAFKRDRTTVNSAVTSVNYHLKANYSWWPMAKADLIDAWDEKLYPQQNERIKNERSFS